LVFKFTSRGLDLMSVLAVIKLISTFVAVLGHYRTIVQPDCLENCWKL